MYKCQKEIEWGGRNVYTLYAHADMSTDIERANVGIFVHIWTYLRVYFLKLSL